VPKRQTKYQNKTKRNKVRTEFLAECDFGVWDLPLGMSAVLQQERVLQLLADIAGGLGVRGIDRSNHKAILTKRITKSSSNLISKIISVAYQLSVPFHPA
jgi:hypothetical protein